MTITDTLARDNGALDIKDGGNWIPVGGINSWSPSPEKNSADTTKFVNGGWKSHLPASRGLSLTFSGLKQVDESTGSRDPGQAACEALALQMGPSGIAEFRHSMAGGIVNIFEGSVNVTNGGGGNDDPDAWEIEIEMSGPPATTTNAPVPAAPTVPTATPDTGGVMIGWTDGSPAGDLFSVDIIKAGAVVKTVLGSAKPIWVPLANSTGYTATVRARNDAGWSDQSAATSSFTVS